MISLKKSSTLRLITIGYIVINAYLFVKCTKKNEVTPISNSILTFPGINTFKNITLGDQTNNSLGSYFATSNGNVYKEADFSANQNIIDLWVYAHPYPFPDFLSINSPSTRRDAGFTTNLNGKVTYFGNNKADINFDSLTPGRLDSIVISPSSNILGYGGFVSINKPVLATFMNSNKKKGVIRITSASFAKTSNTNYLKFDIKVQQ